MVFGEELKRLRESRGMTVNQLAMYSDISAASISRIENGKRGVPKPENIKKIAMALKMPYEELMNKAGYLDIDEYARDAPKRVKDILNDEHDIFKFIERINDAILKMVHDIEYEEDTNRLEVIFKRDPNDENANTDKLLGLDLDLKFIILDQILTIGQSQLKQNELRLVEKYSRLPDDKKRLIESMIDAIEPS